MKRLPIILWLDNWDSPRLDSKSKRPCKGMGGGSSSSRQKTIDSLIKI